jgi:protein-S-isoprenylcysteine O-methyltransferase Ste14
LVTTGSYRYVRNPSYPGLLLNLIGSALVFRAGIGILIPTLSLIRLVVRIRSEERLMDAMFDFARGKH